MIKDSIEVKFIYSACVLTTTPDISILHDPWFTEGIYDGSWFHFPKVKNPLKLIGDVDLIYISHIHPDHYDPVFLKEYFETFGTKQILIADRARNYLLNKILSDGFTPRILKEPMVVGKTTVQILPHDTNSNSDIDSSIIVQFVSKDDRKHCVVNTNDIVFDEVMLGKVKSAAEEIDILLCGFAGAGPYPQIFFDLSDERLLVEASKKKEIFFERFKLLTDFMRAKICVPFAGQYILGGRLSRLNRFRGVADAVEVTKLVPSAVVLSDKKGVIDTESLIPSRKRTKNYSKLRIRVREFELRNKKMSYESFFDKNVLRNYNFKKLFDIAAKNAVKNSECFEDYFYCFKLPSDEFAVINANRNEKITFRMMPSNATLPIPRSEIVVDPRYLYGLLTGLYNWNSAEVGSQFSIRRFPNTFNRHVQRFLWHLNI